MAMNVKTNIDSSLREANFSCGAPSGELERAKIDGASSAAVREHLEALTAADLLFETQRQAQEKNLEGGAGAQKRFIALGESLCREHLWALHRFWSQLSSSTDRQQLLESVGVRIEQLAEGVLSRASGLLDPEGQKRFGIIEALALRCFLRFDWGLETAGQKNFWQKKVDNAFLRLVRNKQLAAATVLEPLARATVVAQAGANTTRSTEEVTTASVAGMYGRLAPGETLKLCPASTRLALHLAAGLVASDDPGLAIRLITHHRLCLEFLESGEFRQAVAQGLKKMLATQAPPEKLLHLAETLPDRYRNPLLEELQVGPVVKEKLATELRQLNKAVDGAIGRYELREESGALNTREKLSSELGWYDRQLNGFLKIHDAARRVFELPAELLLSAQQLQQVIWHNAPELPPYVTSELYLQHRKDSFKVGYVGDLNALWDCWAENVRELFECGNLDLAVIAARDLYRQTKADVTLNDRFRRLGIALHWLAKTATGPSNDPGLGGNLYPASEAAQDKLNLQTLAGETMVKSELENRYVRALIYRLRVLGPAHPDVAESIEHLGCFYAAVGRQMEAERLFGMEYGLQHLGDAVQRATAKSSSLETLLDNLHTAYEAARHQALKAALGKVLSWLQESEEATPLFTAAPTPKFA